MSFVDRNERVREATKRQVMGGFLDDGAGDSNIVGTNCEHVSALMEDIKAQFNQRLESLQGDVTASKNNQQQVYASAMVKLSKNVKRMKVREFNALYKCSLLDIIRSICEDQGPLAAATKKRDRMEVETPSAAVRRSSRNLQTPSRTLRRGEVLYSENGSPIDAADEGSLVATITKKRRGNDSSDTTETTDFAINVGEGKFISLTDPSSIGNLDSESRLRAFNHLQALQDQMAKIMQDLSNKDE